jgi:hypothetical protein
MHTKVVNLLVQANRALPLMKYHFSHSLLRLHRILVGMGGGGLKKGGDAPWATKSQRCKSSASRKLCCCVVMLLLCCRMYIPDLGFATDKVSFLSHFIMVM